MKSGHISCTVIIERNSKQVNARIIIKLNASSFEWCMLCLSKMFLDKATRYVSELFEHPS